MVRKQTILRAGLAIGLWCRSAAGAAEATREEEKTIPFPADGLVSLTADEGSVAVRTWERNEVRIQMRKTAWARTRKAADGRLAELNTVIESIGNRIFIREETPADDASRRFHPFGESDREGAKIDYILTVPKPARLKLACDEGDIDVAGTEGDLDAETDEGGIRLENVVSERLTAGCDEGDISIQNARGSDGAVWKTETDEGIVRVEDAVVGSLELTVDEGELIARGIRAGRVEAESDEGDIRISLLPVSGGKYRMESDEGDVGVSVPKNASLSVWLQTEDGGIDSDFRLTVREREDGERREGELGSGGASLKILTQEGEIRLEAETASGR